MLSFVGESGSLIKMHIFWLNTFIFVSYKCRIRDIVYCFLERLHQSESLFYFIYFRIIYITLILVYNILLFIY